MAKGIDEHLKEGGKVSDYKPVDIEKEMPKAVKAEKKKLPEIVRNHILSRDKVLSVDDNFYLMETNALGGGYYKPITTREMSIAIERASGKNYSRRLCADVMDLIHNATNIGREHLNSNKREINLLNGVLDVKTRVLRQFDKRDYFSYQIPVRYDVEAQCNEWLKVLGEIFQGRSGNITLLQQIAGYCLQTASNSEVFFVFFGSGANGKGVVTHVFEHIMGIENTTALGLEKLGDSRWNECLVDKMLNLATESDARASKWSETIKTAVSGEAVLANPKFKTPYKFYPFCKHIITMNERPYIEDKSDGVMRRMVVVPFDRKFAEDERDIGLKRRLVELESSGILNWFIDGLGSYLKFGFTIPEENLNIAREIKVESNSIMLYFEENCHLDSEGRWVSTDEFYRAYSEWCKDSGHKAFSKTKVSRGLAQDYGIKIVVQRDGNDIKRFYQDVCFGVEEIPI